MHQLLSLEAYKHPITGKNLAGPDAEKGPVEIDEDAYQDEIGRLHDFRFHERFSVQFDSFLKSTTCCEEWRQLWLKQILYGTQEFLVENIVQCVILSICIHRDRRKL